MNKVEFLKVLNDAADKYRVKGRANQAIENHIAKVSKMTEAECAAHQAKLSAMAPQFAAAAKQMVNDLGPIQFVAKQARP